MKRIVLTVGAALVLSTAHAQAAPDSLLVGTEYIFAGQGINAGSCFYNLRMQMDGNLVLRNGDDAARWASNTVGKGLYAVMQTDGNFVVYNYADVKVYETETWGNPGALLRIQDDGNLVIRRGLHWVWDSGTAGPVRSQTPCVRPRETTFITGNTDRFGGDFRSLTRFSYSACAFDCVQDNACRAFTWVAASRACFLKSSIPAATTRSGMVSGFIDS